MAEGRCELTCNGYEWCGDDRPRLVVPESIGKLNMGGVFENVAQTSKRRRKKRHAAEVPSEDSHPLPLMVRPLRQGNARNDPHHACAGRRKGREQPHVAMHGFFKINRGEDTQGGDERAAERSNPILIGAEAKYLLTFSVVFHDDTFQAIAVSNTRGHTFTKFFLLDSSHHS